MILEESFPKKKEKDIGGNFVPLSFLKIVFFT